MERRRNDPCPCGSGRKYKSCCAESAGTGSDLLGQAAELVRRGDLPAAAELYAGAGPVGGDAAEAYYRLGAALNKRGLTEEGAACYRQALLLRPDYVEALNNLGVILKEREEYAEAAELLLKALQLRPEAAIGHYNVGVVLEKLNRYAEACVCFEQALMLQPDYVEAHYNLGLLAREEGEWAKARTSLRRAVELRCDYPRAQAELAILAWMKGDFVGCSSCLEQISHSRLRLSGKEQKFVEPYRNFLGQLLAYRESHGELYQGNSDLPVLYAVGDSHCLAPAHLQVAMREGTCRVEARIVVGAKAWHLGRKQFNPYKRTLAKVVAAIPPGSTALALFGEIDCRLDEGIIRHHRQTGNDLTMAIPELVGNYLAGLAQLFGAGSIRLMVANVPAPNIKSMAVSEEERRLRVFVVQEFNRELGTRCAERNLPLVDVYNASVRPDGLAQEQSHLDSFHLKPALYKRLLEEL